MRRTTLRRPPITLLALGLPTTTLRGGVVLRTGLLALPAAVLLALRRSTLLLTPTAATLLVLRLTLGLTLGLALPTTILLLATTVLPAAATTLLATTIAAVAAARGLFVNAWRHAEEFHRHRPILHLLQNQLRRSTGLTVLPLPASHLELADAPDHGATLHVVHEGLAQIAVGDDGHVADRQPLLAVVTAGPPQLDVQAAMPAATLLALFPVEAMGHEVVGEDLADDHVLVFIGEVHRGCVVIQLGIELLLTAAASTLIAPVSAALVALLLATLLVLPTAATAVLLIPTHLDYLLGQYCFACTIGVQKSR